MAESVPTCVASVSRNKKHRHTTHEWDECHTILPFLHQVYKCVCVFVQWLLCINWSTCILFVYVQLYKKKIVNMCVSWWKIDYNVLQHCTGSWRNFTLHEIEEKIVVYFIWLCLKSRFTFYMFQRTDKTLRFFCWLFFVIQ